MAAYWTNNGLETTNLLRVHVRGSCRGSDRENGNARHDGGAHVHENAYEVACRGESGGVNEGGGVDGCDCADDYANEYVDVCVSQYAHPRCHPHHAHGYERSRNHDQPTAPLPTPQRGRTGHSDVMMDH